ncbi:dual specificity protein kinase kns1 [Mortierella sp. NVP85]|nr:dual specificity protein kinase kns1 [Mortierella sp. NVP85]
MNGSSSHASNQHYAYPRQYAPIHLDDGHPATIYSDSTVRPDIGSSPTGTSAHGKKKRRPNTDTKYVQPRVPPENQAPYQPPTPKSHGNATMANRNAVTNIPPWDDKEGHYIVVVNEDFTSRYKIIRLLGQGTFGKVVECYDRDTGRHCAIKIIRAVQKYRDASKIEARVLTTLKQNDPPNAFLKLIHTDLKPENILLKNGAFKSVPYKALFQTHDNLEHLAMMQAVLGPIPDKLIRTCHKSAQKYFVHGRLDYPNEETKRNSRKYVKALRPLKDYVVPTANRAENLNFAAALKDLLSKLLTYDPDQRITASQALKHPYFTYRLDEAGQITGRRTIDSYYSMR